MPASTDPTRPEQRIVEAAAVLPLGGGAVTGWASLCWRGGRWFRGGSASGSPLPVRLVTWGDVRPQRGIEVMHETLDPREVEIVDGVPVTTAVRTVFHLMRYAAGVREATVVADMAAYDDLVGLAEVASYAAVHRGWTGVPQAREALALANENAWSPMEVRTRLAWECDALLPRLLTNAPVFDLAGGHVATPDLLDTEAGLAIEYDGAVHLEDRHRRRDRDRHEALRQVGIDVLVVIQGDLADRDRVAGRMRAARSRAPWQPAELRRWTVQPPPGWVSTHTVDGRRALDAGWRRRLLGYRDAA